MGQALVQELQAQGKYEAALARFQPDDDEPRVPSPLDSAQSRRSMPVEVH